MKPLSIAQQTLPYICCSFDVNSSRQEKIIYIACSVILLSISVTASVAGIMYMKDFSSLDLEDFLVALTMCSGVVGVSYMMIVLISSRKKVTTMFKKLTEIYIESKNPIT